MWWRRLILLIKLRYIEWKLSKRNAWNSDLTTACLLLPIIDDRLFDDYKPTKGKKLYINSCFKNVAELQQQMTFLIFAIKSREYIEDSFLAHVRNRREVSLDDFMTDNTNRSVFAKDVFRTLKTNIDELKASLDNYNNDEIRSDYYKRKTNWIVTDLFELLEALLSVAMSNE